VPLRSSVGTLAGGFETEIIAINDKNPIEIAKSRTNLDHK